MTVSARLGRFCVKRDITVLTAKLRIARHPRCARPLIRQVSSSRPSVPTPVSDMAPTATAPAINLTGGELELLRGGTRFVLLPDAVFRIEGTGALQCVQGLFTNDIIKCAPDALRWGGVLTPKGMIIFDMWVLRDGDAAWSRSRCGAGGCRRPLPSNYSPRIARVTDHSDTLSVGCYLGGSVAAEPNAICCRRPGALRCPGISADAPAPQRWSVAGAPPCGRAPRAARGGRHSAGDRCRTCRRRCVSMIGGVRSTRAATPTGNGGTPALSWHANRTLLGLDWDAAVRPIPQSCGSKSVGSIGSWGMIADARSAWRRSAEVNAGDVGCRRGTRANRRAPFDIA